jgi:hypothetical protein
MAPDPAAAILGAMAAPGTTTRCARPAGARLSRAATAARPPGLAPDPHGAGRKSRAAAAPPAPGPRAAARQSRAATWSSASDPHAAARDSRVAAAPPAPGPHATARQSRATTWSGASDQHAAAPDSRAPAAPPAPGPRQPVRHAGLPCALAAAAAVLLLLAGCGGSGDGPADRAPPGDTLPAGTPAAGPQPPSDAGQLDRLLAARAAALEAGDATGYAATATGRQRARDRAAARRARRLGLRDVLLYRRRADVRGSRARLRVTLAYRFRGVPARFVAAARLRARRTAAGWRIAAVDGRRERPPWEVARFRRVPRAHVLLLAPPGVDAVPLVGALDAAYRGMAARLPGRRLPRRVLAVAAVDADQARRLTTTILGVRTLAAIADAAVQETGPASEVAGVVSRRLLVVAPVWAAMDAARRQRVLVHELTHLALADITSGRVPAWLVEGAAMETSGDDRSADAALRAEEGRGVPLTALCRPDSIARLTGDEQAGAYATASAAAHRIAAMHGRRSLLRLYAAFGDERIPGRPGCRLTDRVLRHTLGMRLRDLTAAMTG